MLAIQGFKKWQTLGLALFQLTCTFSIVVPKKGHHDFGLRAIKNVCKAAAHLLKKGNKEAESVAIACKYVFTHRFDPKTKEAAFRIICIHLFDNDQSMLNTLQSHTMDIQCEHPELRKIHEALCFRHSVLVVTEKAAQCVKNMTEFCKSEKHTEHSYDLSEQTNSTLFGDDNDGLFSKALEEANAKPDQHTCFIFYGAAKPDILESLNQVLDDNKKIVSKSGKTILVPKNVDVAFVFSEKQCHECSPAFISRNLAVTLDHPEDAGQKKE